MDTRQQRRIRGMKRLMAETSLFLSFLSIAPCLAAEGDAGGIPYRDCRYSPEDGLSRGEDPGPLEGNLFPDDDLFRPLLADVKQPGFYTSYRRIKFRSSSLPSQRSGRAINAGIAGLGKDLGLWGLRRSHGCSGVQVSLFGAAFSQFNLSAPSSDLMNTDFLVGFPITMKHGALSARFRVFHQSSHLGDEFLLNNPGVKRTNLSFEAVDALVSVENRWGRLYGGGGYLFDSSLRPGMAQCGVELRGPARRWWLPGRGGVVFGADFNASADRDWAVTTSLAGGLEWTNPRQSHRVRVLATYLRGFLPFSQYFNSEKIDSYGFDLQFGF